MVLPAPGGPSRNTWCPPAAAASIAPTASSLPMTSARSLSSSPSLARAGCRMGSSGAGWNSPPCQIAASSNDVTPTTRTPGTRDASSTLPVGTMTVSYPARTSERTAGRMPGMGRNRPSSPSSPRCTTRSIDSALIEPAAASAATAIPRSNPDPCFGRDAGERLMVIL